MGQQKKPQYSTKAERRPLEGPANPHVFVLGFSVEGFWGVWGFRGVALHRATRRFMGSYKWGHKSLNMSHNYDYPTYDSTYNHP